MTTNEKIEEMQKALGLQCKIGDTVYQLDNAGRIYESMVFAITIYSGRLYFETLGIAFDERAIGKSIFLTKEEAEAEAKRRG